MGRLAQSVFGGSPTEKLAPADVYGGVDTAVRNYFRSSHTAFGEELETALSKSVSKITTIGKDTLSKLITPESARDMVLGVLGSSKTALDNLKGSVQKTIIGEISRDNPVVGEIVGAATGIGGVQDQLIRYGNSTEIVRGLDFESAEGIASILRDISDSDVLEVINVGVDVALFRGVLEEVTQWGLPGLVDDVLQSIEDDRVRREVVSRSSRNFVNTADIDSVEAMLNSVGASALTAQYPDFPRQLLNRYRFKSGTTPDNYPALIGQLVRVMDKLQPQWFFISRGDEPVWNLSVINLASPDAQLLFLSDEDYRTPFLIAPQYPQRDIKAIARDMYPLIAFVS